MICFILSGKQKINFPEFLEIMWKMMQKSRNPERDIFEAFKVYDTKKQGVISMKDLKHVMMRTGEKLSQQDCKLLFFIDMFCYLGPSIKDVRTNLAIFRPPLPPCPHMSANSLIPPLPLSGGQNFYFD